MFTADDSMVAGGVSTAISTLLLQRYPALRVSGWAGLGQISFSILLAYNIMQYLQSKEQQEAIELHKLELDAASKNYMAHTGRPAPGILYDLNRSRPSGDPSGEYQRTSYPPQYPGHPSSESPFEGVQPLGFPDSAKIEPQPAGSQPHNCVLFNGSLVYGTTRDYFWEPESADSGIKALKEHVEQLNEKRTKLVQEAAFLFQEVAQRENKYLALDKDEHDTEVGRKSRKAMELLSSMHSNTYTEIAELDWLISDSKKMILQLETNGTWMPKSPGTPDPKVTEAVLDKIRQHQKKTENMLQQLGYLVVPAEAQPQLEEDLREVKENTEATTDLVEYFEGISKPR